MSKRSYLQPLRVTSGWLITINNFFDEETSQKIKDYFSPSVILAACHNSMSAEIVVEFQFNDECDGIYTLTIKRKFYDKSHKRMCTEVIHTMQTEDRQKLINTVENYMLYGHQSDFLKESS